MIVNLGAIAAQIENPARLNDEEKGFLTELADDSAAGVTLDIADGVFRTPRTAQNATTIHWDGDTAILTNRFFSGSVDTRRRHATFARGIDEAWPLRQMLRAVSTILLPIDGWLPIHAAAVTFEGEVVLFPATSGGGKTTLASKSVHPVLGDEMIAVDPARGVAQPTVFWGDAKCHVVPSNSELPLRAIVTLRKGGSFALERLSTGAAVRLLMTTSLAPIAEATATQITTLVAATVERFPCGVLTWHRDAPPWDELARSLSAMDGRAP